MGATTSRSGFALLLSAALLAGLMVVPAVAVGADDDDAELKKAFEQAGLEWFDGPGDGADDDDDESGVGMDALSGLAADEGGGDTSDEEGTGNLNDPMGEGTGGAGGDADATSDSDTGKAEGSDPADPSAQKPNPFFELMRDYLVEELQAYEAEAKAAGKTLTETQRAEFAKRTVQDLIAFLQESGILGEVDKREIVKQIEGIPTEPQDSSSKSLDPSKTDDD